MTFTDSHLDALDSKVQHLVGCCVDEGEVDPRQTGEDEFLRNLVDQRDAETFLQVHQNLMTTHGSVATGGTGGNWWQLNHSLMSCHGLYEVFP